MKKKDFRELSTEEIKTFLVENNQKSFRVKQIEQWLWEKGVQSFVQMKNISNDLCSLLNDYFSINQTQIIDKHVANDGTTKIAFQFYDNSITEGVFIPSGKRVTACVSSQTGCKLNCSFCATGKLNHGRDLTAAEIFDQVFAIRKMAEEQEKNFTNIVYMGMGEPLLNYDNVKRSIDIITGKSGLKMSPYRITLSTAGIVPGIIRLADDQVRFHLAISLHSAVEETRNLLMPINKKYPLDVLSEAVQYFYHKTNERITFEYLMIKGVNDSLYEAAALAEFCKDFPVKINLIEYNQVEGFNYEPSAQKTMNDFVAFLESKNMIVNVRRSKGKEIDAACGQLVNKKVK